MSDKIMDRDGLAAKLEEVAEHGSIVPSELLRKAALAIRGRERVIEEPTAGTMPMPLCPLHKTVHWSQAEIDKGD